MNKIKILMHTQPNKTSYNAQDLNGREIACRLNKDTFDIYFINTLNEPIDEKLVSTNIYILNACSKYKTIREILKLKYKLFHKYHISFYVRVFKSDSLFLKLKKLFRLQRITIHMVENMLPYPNASKEYQTNAKYNALNSDLTFPISKKVAETIKHEYHRDMHNIMHVGVDTSIFKPNINKNNQPLRVVCCGTFQQRKQPDLFADIAKEFCNTNFYWVGEGPLKNNIQKRIENESINNLNLLDNMSHNELSQFLSNCDIFLFTSIHEGFPKVLIEAMASGLPVIVFNTYGPEAVVDNETGFIVSDVAMMKEKLNKLIVDSMLRKEMSLKAIERAREFDWNFIAKQWEQIIIKSVKK